MGYIDLQTNNEYLDHVKPAYPDWRREARSHPEQANLCNADLIDAKLGGANLSHAKLRGANLSGANLGRQQQVCENLLYRIVRKVDPLPEC